MITFFSSGVRAAILGYVLPLLTAAQSIPPSTHPGEDWSFPYDPEIAPYSGLFRMGNAKQPGGIVKHVGRTLTWAALNPREDVYDFTFVENALAAAKSGGYGVIFRLKASLLSGVAEEGQGQAQSTMVPRWVIDKYANTDTPVPSFAVSLQKTYIAPWHAGVQSEFAKLLREWGRRRYLESENLLGLYLHGVSSSSGEEMYVGDKVDLPAVTAAATACGFSDIGTAITSAWKHRMDLWQEAAGPYVFKIVWVGAGSWQGVHYDQRGLDAYALHKGLGARHGFIERYYYGSVHPPVAGQRYDGAYVSSDWRHPLRDGRYWGDENEEDDEYDDPTHVPAPDKNYVRRPLPPGEAHELAYRSSFFRAAQLGMNFLWTENGPIDWAGNSDGLFTNDPLPTWFIAVAGKGPTESPDAACWLREAQIRYLPLPPYQDQTLKPTEKNHPTQPWKNFERMLMQRDVPGAITRGAAWMLMPKVSLKKENPRQPREFAEFTARATNVTASPSQRSIAFRLEPEFKTSLGHSAVLIKVTYLDDTHATWEVRIAKGALPPVSAGRLDQSGMGGWKTATFTVDAATLPFVPGDGSSPLGDDVDFSLHVPSGSSDLTVRYVRVVRTVAPRQAPTIRVHPQSQSLQPGKTTTLHVVARGTGPLSYTWRHQGVIVQEGSSPVLECNRSQTGYYTVTVVNRYGGVTSNLTIIAP